MIFQGKILETFSHSLQIPEYVAIRNSKIDWSSVTDVYSWKRLMIMALKKLQDNGLGKTQNTLGNKFSVVKVQRFICFWRIWFGFIRKEITDEPWAKTSSSIACPCLSLPVFQEELHKIILFEVLTSPRWFPAFAGFLVLLFYLFSFLFMFCNHIQLVTRGTLSGSRALRIWEGEKQGLLLSIAIKTMIMSA